MTEIQNSKIIPELHSPFEQLREMDADDKEWWNSRKLTKVMGYGKFWNFERVIAKAQAWTSQKGYHIGEHFVESYNKNPSNLLCYWDLLVFY